MSSVLNIFQRHHSSDSPSELGIEKPLAKIHFGPAGYNSTSRNLPSGEFADLFYTPISDQKSLCIKLRRQHEELRMVKVIHVDVLDHHNGSVNLQSIFK